MFRGMLSWLILICPALALLSTGCQEDKVETVQRTEEVHESEPEMVPPGYEEIVE